ncbi:MetQ/NlpA family ABC transporter substrate-binding protein [Terrisporobacter vanillatitrophus]|uniref:MetQ/NlpA family ABC transporter substrate-binding protein n=1 Tax=Terrisporobacter vanillatitrophus TaxID=3058402 RepID=UPI0033692135
MKLKKLLGLTLVGVIGASLFVGCSKSGGEEDKTIKVGASPTPHAEILEVVKPLLKEKGYELEVVEFDDYVLPNTSLAEGELDANYFQHVPYLEQMNKEKDLKLTYTAKVHIEPMGIYSNKYDKLDELKDGAKISVPNDATNEARALQLLADNGIIEVADKELITAKDITKNPKNVEIVEVEAAQVPSTLQDVDFAVINTNFALNVNLNPTKDALAIESSDSPYANILACREDNKDSEKVKALTEALTSDEVKSFIEEKYKGSIVPTF